MIAHFLRRADCEIRVASLTFRTSCHGSDASSALPASRNPLHGGLKNRHSCAELEQRAEAPAFTNKET
jgi:hypothetical protein